VNVRTREGERRRMPALFIISTRISPIHAGEKIAPVTSEVADGMPATWLSPKRYYWFFGQVTMQIF
jgi:hypothetical protein